MISGVNPFGSFSTSWYNPAGMNDTRLAMALTQRSAAAQAALKQKTADAVSKRSATALAAEKDRSEFLQEYQSHMSNLEKLAGDLSLNNGDSLLNTMSATSSDRSVLTASTRYPVRQPAAYQVEVEQLASAQQNVSAGVDGTGHTLASGSLTLQTQVGTFTMEIDATQAENDRDLLSAIADEINAQKMGVTAQLAENDGKLSLALTGTGTGASNGFLVGGDFAEQSGLQNVARAAADAVYTVTRTDVKGPAQRFTSSENKVTIGGYQVEATLKQTGTAQVTVGTDNDAVADKVGELLGEYNKTLQFLEKNSDRGVGVLQQLRRMTQPPTSLESMKLAGITMAKDGSYSVDKAALSRALSRDPALTRSIVGGSFGVAQGIERDAQMGKVIPEKRLTQYDELSQLEEQSGRQSTTNLLSLYNRSGAYNLLNYYAVGMMMNFNA